MKRILPVILLLVNCLNLNAENPVRFNVEWGYNICFASDHVFQYHSEDGSTVLDYGPYKDYIGTGFVNVGLGTVILKHFSVNLSSGFMGICPESKIISIQLGVTWRPWDVDEDGLMFFAEGGTGFHTIYYGDMPFLARVGALWRVVLNKRVSIDSKLSFRYISDHPAIIDQSTRKLVDESQVIKNDARFGYVAISFGLNF